MALLACILAVVSCIWEPVRSAAESFLGTETQGCITFFRNWVVGQASTLVSSWRGDFEEVPVSTTAIVGAEETLAEIRAHLNDNSAGIIGFYGMGGAGKTTLLRRINNDLSESRTTRSKFDLGIWVTVSKEVSIPAIQKQIARRLRITLSDDESQDATTLFQALSKRRFLVLLDDLWAKLDLVRVGIPVPTIGRNCKISFTMRSLEVCSKMDATRCVEVKRLGDGPSWELFSSKVGTGVDLHNFRARFPASLPCFLYSESLDGAIALLIHLRSKGHRRWDGAILNGALCAISDKFKPPWPLVHLLWLAATVVPTWQVVPTRGTISDVSFKVEWKRKLAIASPRRPLGRPRAATTLELLRVCRELQGQFEDGGIRKR